MSKRIGRWIFSGALLLGVGAFLFAHDPEKKSSMEGMMMECQEHHAGAMKARDEVNTHLGEAKRAGTMADMRRHVELAEKGMAEMEKHMSLCMGMMHGGMKSGGMMSEGKSADPVCGMMVDPGTAPSATYKGKTYYFCSEDDKRKFEKNSEQYLKKS
jgi:YHS domain-containing protein